MTNLTPRQYKIYEWYFLNFKKKELHDIVPLCIFKYTLDGFISLYTLGKSLDNRYCPHCCIKVDSISYNDSPIHTYGCNNCRTRKVNYES